VNDTGKEALRSCMRLAGQFNQMLDDEDFRQMASEIEWDGDGRPWPAWSAIVLPQCQHIGGVH